MRPVRRTSTTAGIGSESIVNVARIPGWTPSTQTEPMPPSARAQPLHALWTSPSSAQKATPWPRLRITWPRRQLTTSPPWPATWSPRGPRVTVRWRCVALGTEAEVARLDGRVPVPEQEGLRRAGSLARRSYPGDDRRASAGPGPCPARPPSTKGSPSGKRCDLPIGCCGVAGEAV